MSGTETLAVTIVVAGMAYTALCLGIPEIRIYYRGSDKKIGPVGSVGLALFFWALGLGLIGSVTGLIPEGWVRQVCSFGVYLLVCLGVVVAIIGFYVDPSA